jgi:hypothetical protein
MRLLLPVMVLAFAIPAPTQAAENIALPSFRSVELRGGGDVVLVRGPVQRVTILQGSSAFTRMTVERGGQLRIDACNDRCPRNYQLRIQIQAPRVPDVGVSGGGSIAVQPGFAPQSQLAAGVSGGGKIDVRALEAVTVSAAVNGGGQLLVRPRATLNAAVNGGGSIRYWGNPQVTSAIQGGGSINRGN